MKSSPVKCPPPSTQNNIEDSKFSLSSRHPPRNGIEHLSWSVVSLLSAYIHSSYMSKCTLSTPPPLPSLPSLPPKLRVPVKRTASAVQSLWAARYLRTSNAHDRPPLFPVFFPTLDHSVKKEEWRKYCGLDAHACHGWLSGSKRWGWRRRR